MALLGHTARIIISVTSLPQSSAAWQAAGFEVESEAAGATRLTDGQVLVTLLADDFDGPALAYFNVDPVRLLNDLGGKGLSTREVNDNGYTLEGPGGIDIYIHRRSAEQAEQPTGEQNPLLGYVDALVIGVDDPVAARRTAEDVGFFVQEEDLDSFPRSDVTDGLLNLSFRKQKGKPFLVYQTDLDDELVDELTSAFGDACTVRTNNDGQTTLIMLTMPEGTRLMITNEDEGDEE